MTLNLEFRNCQLSPVGFRVLRRGVRRDDCSMRRCPCMMHVPCMHASCSMANPPDDGPTPHATVKRQRTGSRYRYRLSLMHIARPVLLSAVDTGSAQQVPPWRAQAEMRSA
jgi:hypothetical protein